MLMQQRAFGGHKACPARSKALPEPGITSRRAYRRAAQAYMLISMPTDTSTIFGVVQLIKVSPKQCWHDIRASTKTRETSNTAQGRKTIRCRRPHVSDAGYFPLGQGYFTFRQGNPSG